MSKTIFVKNIGKMSYMEAWQFQKKLAEEVSNNIKYNQPPSHKLIIVEHPPVYTIGIRRSDYTIEEENKLTALGAEFFGTNRGGLITFHGPGQLVAYPILHLRSFGKGIRWYVSALERTVINCLHNFNIFSHTTSDTGIWIENRKICAIGIQGRHVTSHGLAINCDIDLTWFDHIVPCGLQGKTVTSISKETQKTTIKEVIPHFLKSFENIFEANLMLEKNHI